MRLGDGVNRRLRRGQQLLNLLHDLGGVPVDAGIDAKMDLPVWTNDKGGGKGKHVPLPGDPAIEIEQHRKVDIDQLQEVIDIHGALGKIDGDQAEGFALHGLLEAIE